jgi:hypothetical protein
MDLDGKEKPLEVAILKGFWVHQDARESKYLFRR